VIEHENPNNNPEAKNNSNNFYFYCDSWKLERRCLFCSKYLKEQQQIRDASRDCVHYRDFLLASDAWEQEGDTDQAQGVYALAIHHFKKGQCTQIH
jgi:hypothetical protein